MILKNYINKIFQNKIKNEHSVHFYELRDPSEELGISHPMIRTTRYDWLRLAKAIMDDYQNDTCVGKYLKKIYEKRIPKNLLGLPKKVVKNIQNQNLIVQNLMVVNFILITQDWKIKLYLVWVAEEDKRF